MTIQRLARLLALSLPLLASPAPALAVEYPAHDLEKLLVVSDGPGGKKNYALDLRYMDQVIGDLLAHAGDYPPQFDSQQQMQRAIQDVNGLATRLEILVKSDNPDPQFILRAAQVYRAGHNLEVAGATARADQLFQQYLRLRPDDPQANYQYGLFLARTPGQTARGLPYLGKAATLGVVDANYSLGLAYIAVGQPQKAEGSLETYLRMHSEDQRTRELLALVQRASLGASPQRQ